MTTSIILHNFDSKYENETCKKKLFPKMKYNNSDYYSYDKENCIINNDFGQEDAKNKVNKMNYLFPSIPIKVS